MSKRVANTLNKAADYIEQHGWCRNAFYDPRGQVCLAGAIGVVAGALKPIPTERRLAKLEAEGFGDDYIARAKKGDKNADAYLWEWTKNKTALGRYHEATFVLAEVIGNGDVTNQLEQFDKGTEQIAHEAWFLNMSDEDQAGYMEARERSRANLLVDVVTTHNDATEVNEKTGKARYRTTKKQAINLLRQAAAVA